MLIVYNDEITEYPVKATVTGYFVCERTQPIQIFQLGDICRPRRLFRTSPSGRRRRTSHRKQRDPRSGKTSYGLFLGGRTEKRLLPERKVLLEGVPPSGRTKVTPDDDLMFAGHHGADAPAVRAVGKLEQHLE